MKIETVKLVWFACFHFIVSYGIILGENSKGSKTVLYIQNRIIIIMEGIERKVSCRELFKKFNILPLASTFLFSLLPFILNNMEKF
jgi:hypothetical protein